jgi:hypothetical protein
MRAPDTLCPVDRHVLGTDDDRYVDEVRGRVVSHRVKVMRPADEGATSAWLSDFSQKRAAGRNTGRPVFWSMCDAQFTGAKLLAELNFPVYASST